MTGTSGERQAELHILGDIQICLQLQSYVIHAHVTLEHCMATRRRTGHRGKEDPLARLVEEEFFFTFEPSYELSK